MCEPPQQIRQKIPKDGVGPRGVPDCYYTSRVLNSTFRYVKFVKKLRALEEEQRRGAENKLKDLKDKQYSDFFISCDRRSLINNVARRVELCMASYEEDLKRKRQRLLDMYAAEEKANIRKLVEQAQAGAEALWQDKKNRLQHLLEKRKKEHLEKYKDTPLSKCVHVLPCLFKLRAAEAADIQLYQMREKQARKMAELELDKMWHEVAMKESEALAARMEVDSMERLRRERECRMYSDLQLQQREQQREDQRHLLREEARRFKALWDEDIRREEEVERKRTEQSLETARERKLMMQQRQQTLARQHADERLLAHTWDSLAGQGRADELDKIQLARRKERELAECNKKLSEQRQEFSSLECGHEEELQAESRRRQDETLRTRCGERGRARDTQREVRAGQLDQVRAREEERRVVQERKQEEQEYERQLASQLQRLATHQAGDHTAHRRLHQQDLREQIEYNKLLKERARQEELDQVRKCQLATEEYQRDINRMMCRPFFSEEVHPFMKQMARGLKMKDKCPCTRPDHCH